MTSLRSILGDGIAMLILTFVVAGAVWCFP